MPTRLPRAVAHEIFRTVKGVEGLITDREIRFLATAAAFPTAEGSILELGCYQGKSTIVIAKASRLAGPFHFVTVDPLIGEVASRLHENLRRAGVDGEVEVHREFSCDFVSYWDSPIRFLFHDGSNKADEVRQDIVALREHLSDGAIVAFHDVLNTSGERAVVFADQVLGSDHFGPAGFCGSIGWGQFFSNPSFGAQYRAQRLRYRKRLLRLLPFLNRPLNRFDKTLYKLLRSCIPHHRVGSGLWISSAMQGGAP